MKSKFCFVAIALLSLATMMPASGKEVVFAPMASSPGETAVYRGVSGNKGAVVYRDASAFPLYGKCIENTSARYERLPAACKDISRKPVWRLGRNSAGLFLRFRSDSPCIYARWESLFGNHMNHMTDTGVRGLDLYALEEGEWRFAGSGRPSAEKLTEAALVLNMDGRMREYLLYLSLYDGVARLEIGIEDGSLLEAPALDYPCKDGKIVMYGTSILQGGCVSRSGMAATAMIGRKTGHEVINLGFSGNALLDFEIAELMAQVAQPGVFVLDYVPNASAKQIEQKGESFFRVLRNAHPGVPVIFVEDPLFPHGVFDRRVRKEVETKNAAQFALFRRLKKAGEKHIWYISADQLIGTDGEATVDGIHFTDVGTMRYTETVLPVIRKALRKSISRR